MSLRQQPIAEVISKILSQADVESVIDPGISGKVSGEFRESSSEIYRRLIRAFHLCSYYDGLRAYIYPVQAIRSAQFGNNRAESIELLHAVRDMGVSDGQDRVRLDGDRLVAVGVPRYLEQVADAARNASAQPVRPMEGRSRRVVPENLEYRVFPLKYAWAQDVKLNSGGQAVTVPGVVTILRGLVGPGRTAPSGSDEPFTEQTPATQTGLVGRGLASQGRDENSPNSGSLGAGLANLFGVVGAGSKPPVVPAVARPRAEAPREVARIEADARLNAVIVRDTPLHLASLASLIAALDRPPKMIEIEAAIIDVDLDRLSATGVSFEYTGAGGNQVLLAPTTPGATLPSGQGLVISAVIGSRDKFLANIQALEQRGAARIVSRPLVVTLSDVEATFRNNQTFYVPVSGSLSTDLYNVVAGTQLRVTPHVIDAATTSSVRLLVDVQDGSISTQNVGSLPIVENSGLNTEALIQDGQSLLLGGMVTQSTNVAEGRVPLLSDLPIAGALFRSGSREVRHTERLFLITPHLAEAGRAVPTPPGTEPIAPKLAQQALQGEPQP